MYKSVHGGDIYSDSLFDIEKVSQILKNIQSHYGKFAVLGEKDQNDSNDCTNLLTEAGFDKILEECQKQAKAYVEQ